MANEGDLSSASEEFHLNISLQQQKAKKALHLRPKGLCHYCNNPVKPEQIFCDDDCADDYEYELKRRRVNGQRH